MEKEKSAQEMEVKAKAAKMVFGSFFLNKTEMVLSIEHIQEVVNYPENVSTLPLSPDFMEGMFNLRGMIVPIINLKKLLNYEDSGEKSGQKVAMLNFGGARVGLAFDLTGEIIHPSVDEKSNYQYNKGSQYNVISGALKLDQGKRILQILDPEALISIKNIPQFVDLTNSNKSESLRHKGLHSNRKRCITFNVGDVRLAFEITGIHEITSVPELQRSPAESELCLGMINLRGHTVPVLSFSKLLKQNTPQQEKSDENRLIVLKIENEFVGLLVDSVETINWYSTDGVMPIPILSEERTKMFHGCISIPGHGDVILVDQKEILNTAEIFEITQGHAKMYQAKQTNAEARAASGQKHVYISFQLNQLFGVSIEDVKEIINYPKDIFDAPGMPHYVKGMLNLRGNLVTIVDTRAIYKINTPSAVALADMKVLIFQRGLEQFGLIVDSVDSIMSVDSESKLRIPEVLSKGEGNTIDQDLKEVISIRGGGPTLAIISVTPVFERIKRGA